MTHRILGLILGAAVTAAPFAWAEMTPELTPSQAVRDADIVFLGEIHDNPAHHRLQADLMAAVQPTAVVFEMLTPEQADLMRGTTFNSMAELDALIGWEAAGWPDIEIYAPVLTSSFDLPVFGAAVPRDRARAIIQTGAAAEFGAEADRFGLTTALPDDQFAERRALQHDAHCGALPAEMLPQMIEVQRFRDARLAQVALEAFTAHGGPVVVITGNGHARTDWGAPFALQHAQSTIETASVGLLESPPTVLPPYDSWVVTDSIDRPDPCLAFK